MGCFSWMYSDTERQVTNGKYADTYLLVPEPFQKKYGKSIHETCYDGYGMFDDYDVYELVPEWNKEMIPEIIKRIMNHEWKCSVNERDIQELQNYYDGNPIDGEIRHLGIIMACYDEDNFKLKYPIKITSVEMDYKDAKPSIGDPMQGFNDW